MGFTPDGFDVFPGHGNYRLDGANRQAPHRAARQDRRGSGRSRKQTWFGDHGTSLGRPGRGTDFVHQYRRLADRLGELRDKHRNVGVLVDAFHLFASGETIEAGFVWGSESVVWVHVADSANSDRLRVLDQERALPGETGLADCRGLLKRLAEENYQGPVTVEPLAHCRSLQGLDALSTARMVHEALQTVWPGPLVTISTSRREDCDVTIKP